MTEGLAKPSGLHSPETCFPIITHATPTQNIQMQIGRDQRIIRALPFLGLGAAAVGCMYAGSTLPWLLEMVRGGSIVTKSGTVPILDRFYGIGWFDNGIALVNMFFMPSLYGYDAVSRIHITAFLTDNAVVVSIWFLESIRRVDKLAILRMPWILLSLAQIVGGGVVTPIFCFTHYVSSPICKSSISFQWLPSINHVLAVLPAILAGLLVPSYAMLFWPEPMGRQAWLFVWQLFPLFTTIFFKLFAVLFSYRRKKYNPKSCSAGLPIIRTYICLASTLSAAVWLRTWAWASWRPWIMATIFIPKAIPRTLGGLTTFSAELFRFDKLFTDTASLLWLLYLLDDAKAAGVVQLSWRRILSYGIVTLVTLGPGATLGFGWLWREELLKGRLPDDLKGKD